MFDHVFWIVAFRLKEAIQSVSNLVCPGANENKARYTATLVACGRAGAVLEKVNNQTSNILMEHIVGML